MTPVFKYYQFPREVWQGKESAWNTGIIQSDAQYKKLMVTTSNTPRIRMRSGIGWSTHSLTHSLSIAPLSLVSVCLPQHNICGNNCHHHSARALANMRQCGIHSTGLAGMSMISVWWLITRKGRFVSRAAFLCTYMPITIGIIIAIIIGVWAR